MDKKMKKITFKCKNTATTYTATIDDKNALVALLDDNGHAPVPVNKNGKIALIFKSGINGDGNADNNAIFRIIFDCMENGQRHSYSVDDLTTDKIKTLANIVGNANANALFLGKRPKDNNNGQPRATGKKSQKMQVFDDFATLAKSGLTSDYAPKMPTAVFVAINNYWTLTTGNERLADYNAKIADLTQARDDLQKRLDTESAKTDTQRATEYANALALYNHFVATENEKRIAIATTANAIAKITDNADKMDTADIDALIAKLQAEKEKREQSDTDNDDTDTDKNAD